MYVRTYNVFSTLFEYVIRRFHYAYNFRNHNRHVLYKNGIFGSFSGCEILKSNVCMKLVLVRQVAAGVEDAKKVAAAAVRREREEVLRIKEKLAFERAEFRRCDGSTRAVAIICLIYQRL